MEYDNLLQLARFKNEAPHPSYIAGLIDGDGCIFIRKIVNGYQSGITITQCRSNVLQVIRHHFGGSITTSANRNDKMEDKLDDTCEFYHKHNVRNQYNLMIRSNEYKLILDYIRFAMIIKQPQIECLNEIYKLVDVPFLVEEKEVLYKKCSELNKNRVTDEITLIRINVEYIQGLFDAEGCIYINKDHNSISISIAQKNHPVILEKIREFIGYGNVSSYKYNIYNKPDCLKFIALIKPGLIVKYNQAVAFEKYLLTDDLEIKKAMYKICNEEKHKIECFSDINCNDDGKEAYTETMRLKEIKDAACREIRRKEAYKEKSIKMMGAGNHNFGKTKSEETRKKMSIGIRNAKNGISDETILKMRDLFTEGKTNKEVEEITGLTRHTVTCVKTGRIVCRTEVKEEKERLTQEQKNINKRRITLDEMFIVIDKTIAGEKPMAILLYLDVLRLKAKIKNDLTPDIVKNIKRSMSENKMPFYRCEMDEEKYKHYETLINAFHREYK